MLFLPCQPFYICLLIQDFSIAPILKPGKAGKDLSAGASREIF